MRVIGFGGGNFLRFVRGLADPLFVAYGVLYCFIRLSRIYAHQVPYLNDWLTDFIFIPVVAHMAISFSRYIMLKNPSYCYPFFYLFLMALYTSLVFELLLPLYVTTAIADWGDAVAYFTGAVFYYFVHQRIGR